MLETEDSSPDLVVPQGENLETSSGAAVVQTLDRRTCSFILRAWWKSEMNDVLLKVFSCSWCPLSYLL
ncbi:hypothetical protein AOLI_G00091770 [Acnodon oligacanthus]